MPCRSRTTAPGSAAGWRYPSPFGTFYAPNISPDPNDGIGRWSEADFVTAVMKGTSPSGAHYFPAFPYHVLSARQGQRRPRPVRLSEDPAARWRGKVRDHDVPFPFNIRRNIGVWKFLFMDDKPFVADASRSAQWDRGAYLVNSFGHCAECHSPRNFLGGIISAQRFAGGPNPEGEGWVPNITQKGLVGLEREGYRLFPRERADAGRRQRRRIDGARDPQHLAALVERSRRDRRLHQVAAAGRRAAEADEEGRLERSTIFPHNTRATHGFRIMLWRSGVVTTW